MNAITHTKSITNVSQHEIAVMNTMNAPTEQDNRVLLGSQPQYRQRGNDTFDQIISRHRDTYQWALTNDYTMERLCLFHMVLRHLQVLEGLKFFEREGAGDWVPASDKRIEQAVQTALEQDLKAKDLVDVCPRYPRTVTRHSI